MCAGRNSIRNGTGAVKTFFHSLNRDVHGHEAGWSLEDSPGVYRSLWTRRPEARSIREISSKMLSAQNTDAQKLRRSRNATNSSRNLSPMSPFRGM